MLATAPHTARPDRRLPWRVPKDEPTPSEIRHLMAYVKTYVVPRRLPSTRRAQQGGERGLLPGEQRPDVYVRSQARRYQPSLFLIDRRQSSRIGAR